MHENSVCNQLLVIFYFCLYHTKKKCCIAFQLPTHKTFTIFSSTCCAYLPSSHDDNISTVDHRLLKTVKVEGVSSGILFHVAGHITNTCTLLTGFQKRKSWVIL